eukprot:1988361-Pyramimonas_sp.AAC.1
MLSKTELLDVFVLIKCNVTVPILCVAHSAIGRRVFVEFTFAKSILGTLDAPVDGALSAGHIDVINVLG